MDILIRLAIVIFSATLHEIAHGWVADRLGDPTGRLMGRLTLDPRAHIDPLFSIAIPLLLLISGSPVVFGGAKPMPIDPFNLKEGRKDIALVSLAGPLTNLAVAIIGALLLKLLLIPDVATIMSFGVMNGIYFFLSNVVVLNVILGVFNMLPIPPLDGSKVFSLLLPEEMAYRIMNVGNTGFVILFFLMFTGIVDMIMTPTTSFILRMLAF